MQTISDAQRKLNKADSALQFVLKEGVPARAFEAAFKQLFMARAVVTGEGRFRRVNNVAELQRRDRALYDGALAEVRSLYVSFQAKCRTARDLRRLTEDAVKSITTLIDNCFKEMDRR